MEQSFQRILLKKELAVVKIVNRTRLNREVTILGFVTATDLVFVGIISMRRTPCASLRCINQTVERLSSCLVHDTYQWSPLSEVYTKLYALTYQR